MNIRRFRARNVTEALAMVKDELGSDAVILNTSRRRIRDSVSDTATSVVEVVAAVDFDAGEFSSPGMNSGAVPGPEVTSPRRQATVSIAGSEQGEAGVSEDRHAAVHSAGSASDGEAVLRSEIRQLREMVEKMVSRSCDEKSQVPVDGCIPGSDAYHHGSMFSSGRYPLAVLQEVFDLLGIDAVLQRSLASSFLKAVPDSRPVNHRTVYSWLRNYCEGLVVSGPHAHSCGRPCWWSFIGPTGVGKTTTIAKVAAHLKFRHGLKGHLVTVDTYRLGGVEQLKKYAELMEIPFSIARNAGELTKIFSGNRDKDFILVDTIGRNSRSSRHHVELEKMFDAIPGLKAQALLCASYKVEDMVSTVSTYRKFPVCGWTISKIDETGSTGALYSPVIGWKLPISYITDGQKVPEDIKNASRKNIMQILFSKGDAHFSGEKAYSTVRPVKGAGSAINNRHAVFVEGQR